MISDEGFPKKEHLVKTSDFRRVYSRGRSVRKDAYVFYYSANNLNQNRFGAVVGAGNVKRANKRNGIKRLFREVYRKTKGKQKKGYDIVVSVKRELPKTAGYADVEKIFLKLAGQAGILI